jgi:hypothetical protein
MPQTLDYVLKLQGLFARPALAWMLLLQSAFELYEDGAHFKSVFLSNVDSAAHLFCAFGLVAFLQTAWERKKPKWVEWSTVNVALSVSGGRRSACCGCRALGFDLVHCWVLSPI